MPTVKKSIEQTIVTEVISRSPMKKNLIVRVSDEMYAKLGEMAEEMTKQIPGRRTTVSDVARAILEYGLKERKPHYPDYGRYRNNPESED